MTSRCKPKRKALPVTHKRNDEEFVALSEKDLEMERLMASMKGMGGSMYSSEDFLASMKDEMGDEFDEEQEKEL
jgi:hypothetical protein